MPIKSLWRVTIGAAQDWWEDNCLRLAASLAYYTALSLAPLLLLLVGLTGMVLGREQVASQLAAFDAAVNNFTVYVADNPEIVSAQLYSDFTVTIEGTENRINVARRDYNEAVRLFRTRVRSFPNILIAGILGFTPDMYAYFEAQPGTDVAPTLVFPTPVP